MRKRYERRSHNWGPRSTGGDVGQKLGHHRRAPRLCSLGTAPGRPVRTSIRSVSVIFFEQVIDAGSKNGSKGRVTVRCVVRRGLPYQEHRKAMGRRQIATLRDALPQSTRLQRAGKIQQIQGRRCRMALGEGDRQICSEIQLSVLVVSFHAHHPATIALVLAALPRLYTAVNQQARIPHRFAHTCQECTWNVP